jgi:hypothetical protein
VDIVSDILIGRPNESGVEMRENRSSSARGEKSTGVTIDIQMINNTAETLSLTRYGSASDDHECN